jgi:hypothetical protein
MREEHWLTMLENRVQRKIFGPKKEEVPRGLKKLHNENIYNVCCLQTIITVMTSSGKRWVGNVT